MTEVELLQQIFDYETVLLNRIEVLLVLQIVITTLLLYYIVRSRK